MAAGRLGGLAGLRSLPSSAFRTLGVAVGFVVLVGALFAGVGAWQDRDLSAAPTPDSPALTPSPVPQPDDDEENGEAVDGDDDGDEGDIDAPAEDTEATPPPSTGLNPVDVSVQVLNGIGTDGTAAVERTRQLLSDAGFRIAATRNARAYDVTTIFYTVGFEEQGRFVANVLGVNDVRVMTDLPPDRRLNPAVMVHVVLGADRR